MSTKQKLQGHGPSKIYLGIFIFSFDVCGLHNLSKGAHLLISQLPLTVLKYDTTQRDLQPTVSVGDRSARYTKSALNTMLKILAMMRQALGLISKPASYTTNAIMANHSVGFRDELHESEAIRAFVFCFDNASPGKSSFVVSRYLNPSMKLKLIELAITLMILKLNEL